MAQPNSNMKVWFFCFLLLSMTAINHGKLDDKNIQKEMHGPSERKLSDQNNDKPVAANPYNRGCSIIHRCRND
ncbi:hypothetical protein AAZX31_16G083200 [Glycine max]|uniref:RALF-like protein n=2 Tax=Glycine subgen. Soja TaxID=1462606 RepID=K7MG37_SOYBN|nr:hypothetical protein JHK86_044841 [Glycine max]KAG4940820.1 hypothetical protein JHK87_044691 [Glycine soja]KAG4951589.1 hypothetical protein JHK85_045456 [Glycine max]KAG5099443.1 hypothetical protein JHK82_044495 [Glycine max]KAG5108045.1 hypothetical protein JHK84_044952 [Glycine max]